MSEHLRALVVVLMLAVPAFLLSQATLAPVIGREPFRRRWAAWLALTLVLFLAGNQWLYLLATLAVTSVFARHETNPVALYVMLLLVAPPLFVQIPGFGVVNFVADLSHSRLLSLAILLPAALRLSQDTRLPRLGSTAVDRLLLGFIAYTVALYLRDTTLTDTLRQLTYATLDVLLLYYVSSRTLSTRAAAREVLVACVCVGTLLGFTAAFESAKSWLLYSSVAGSLGAVVQTGGYLLRDGMLRASVTTGHSLALGYFFVVAIGALLHLSGFIPVAAKRLALSVVLGLGLLASFARAPWLAGLALLLVHALMSAQALSTFLRRATAVVVLSAAALLTPAGDKIINMLPYVGTVDAFNVEYRERLLEASLAVFWRQPWTGSATFLDTPEMRTMIQGQGIIDMVNSYLQILLAYGLVGLGLFLAMFMLALKRGIGLLRDARLDMETRALAAALCATTVVVLLMIYTVSSITIVPTFYWLLLGMLCALPGKAARSR